MSYPEKRKMKENIILNRTFDFSIQIIELYKVLKRNDKS